MFFYYTRARRCHQVNKTCQEFGSYIRRSRYVQAVSSSLYLLHFDRKIELTVSFSWFPIEEEQQKKTRESAQGQEINPSYIMPLETL